MQAGATEHRSVAFFLTQYKKTATGVAAFTFTYW